MSLFISMFDVQCVDGRELLLITLSRLEIRRTLMLRGITPTARTQPRILRAMWPSGKEFKLPNLKSLYQM